MKARVITALFAIVLAPWSAHATITFEGLPDGTSITTQYAGLNFSNAIVFTAGGLLNELEFPPHSGVNVASDNGGPINITFTSPVLSFSGYFTYSSPLTLTGFDTLNNSVVTANSAFSSNFVSSGNSPNEFLQLAYAGGLSEVTIAGDPAGGSFVVDDINFAVAAPDTGSTVMLMGIGLAGIGWLRRTRC